MLQITYLINRFLYCVVNDKVILFAGRFIPCDDDNRSRHREGGTIETVFFIIPREAFCFETRNSGHRKQEITFQ